MPWRDSRAVSEVVGAILVFGLLILLLSVVQLYAVPNANAGVEYEHSQQAQDDFNRLSEAIERTAETGSSGSVSVALGTQYPTRLVLYNPPPVTGSVSTTEPDEIRIHGASADGPASQYFDGTTVDGITTQQLRYDAQYNEYDADPTFVREAGILYSEFDGNAVTRSRPFISGDSITLVTTSGDLDVNGVDSQLLEPQPVSAPANRTLIENADPNQPVVFSLPTTLDEETWVDALEPEFVENGGHIVDMNLDEGGDRDRLFVALEPGVTYEVKLANVGFGSETVEQTPQYIVPRTDRQTSIDVGGDEKIAVEVRDQYNNPMPGVELQAELVPGNGTIATSSEAGNQVDVTTDATGSAAVTYETPSTLDVERIRFTAEEHPDVDPVDMFVFTGTAGDQPVVMTGASGSDGSDELDVFLQNFGEERDVIGIQFHSGMELTGIEVASRSGLSGTVGGIADDIGDLLGLLSGGTIDFNLIQTDATDLTLAPAAVTNVGLETSSGAASADTTAIRSGPPNFANYGLPSIAPGETATLTLQFDDSYSVGDDTAFAVEFTVYYSGAYAETYQVELSP